MRKTSRVFGLIFSLLASSLAASCGGGNTPSRWDYTEEEISECLEEEGSYSTNNGVTTFEVDMEDSFFNDSLSQNDVIVFDFTELAIDSSKGDIPGDYYSYDIFQEYELPATSFEADEHGHGFDVTFPAQNDNDVYCALVHKSAVISGQYAFFYGEPGEELGGSDSKTSDAIKEIWGYTKSGLKILQSLAGFCEAAMSLDPSKAVSNFISIFDIVGGYVFTSGTSEKEILKSIEGKIDSLTVSLNDVADRLAKVSDEILVQVDRLNVNTLKINLSNFYTNYTDPVNKYLAQLQDYEYLYIKKFIQTNQTVSVYYNKGEDGKYTAVSAQDFDAENGLSYSFPLLSFANALENLKANDNKITDGFLKALYADFAANLDAAPKKPSSSVKTDAELEQDIFNAIVQGFYKDFYAGDSVEDNNIQKTQAIRDLADSYTKTVGGIGVDSILSSYRDLLQYSYNFAQECKDEFVDTCDDFLLTASKLGSLAEIASYYNNYNVNVTDLEADYGTALDNIIAYQNQFNGLNDNYNFVNKTVTKGTFVEVTFGGENHINIYTDQYAYIRDFQEEDGSKDFVTYKIDGSSAIPYACYSSDVLTRMYGRYDIMNDRGAFRNKNIHNFFDYIITRGVIAPKAVKKFVALGSRGADAKFATGLNYRALATSDTVGLTCTFAMGSRFQKGSSYTYGSKGTMKYWEGKTVETHLFYPNGDCERDYLAYGAYYWHCNRFFASDEQYGFEMSSYCFILYSE